VLANSHQRNIHIRKLQSLYRTRQKFQDYRPSDYRHSRTLYSPHSLFDHCCEKASATRPLRQNHGSNISLSFFLFFFFVGVQIIFRPPLLRRQAIFFTCFLRALVWAAPPWALSGAHPFIIHADDTDSEQTRFSSVWTQRPAYLPDHRFFSFSGIPFTHHLLRRFCLRGSAEQPHHPRLHM